MVGRCEDDYENRKKFLEPLLCLGFDARCSPALFSRTQYYLLYCSIYYYNKVMANNNRLPLA